MEDSIDAIADFHVRFFLQTIAKHLKTRRVFFQLVNKIENHAMRSSGPDDVGEAKEPRLETKRPHPTADQTLSSLFAGTVEGYGKTRTVIFGRGERCILAVNHRT